MRYWLVRRRRNVGDAHKLLDTNEAASVGGLLFGLVLACRRRPNARKQERARITDQSAVYYPEDSALDRSR